MLKQFNEQFLNDQYELNEDIISLNENCLLILESDTGFICSSAVSFLSKLAADIRSGSITGNSSKTKRLISIYTTLELLKDRQTHNMDKVEGTSLHKYLKSEPEIEEDELDEMQKIMVSILRKLKNRDSETGTKVRDDNLALLVDDKSTLAKRVSSLKAKYHAMSKRV